MQGKNALVTGGASGIGAATARKLAQEGARVFIADANAGRGEEVVAGIRRVGGRAEFVPVELTDEASIARCAAAVAETTPEYWDRSQDVNLKHQFFAAQAVYPDMKAAQNGAIVNFGSSAWMVGDRNLTIYSTAKAGVLGLTRSLAREFGTDNIRVNCVVPGWIMTQRQIELWLTPEGEKNLIASQCIKRKLYPDDVARLVLFLASDDSSGCTNQSYIIDGGRN